MHSIPFFWQISAADLVQYPNQNPVKCENLITILVVCNSVFKLLFLGWFSWKKFHPLEKQALPSFFNGKSESRTPEIYMEIRDAIMKKFHADPQTQVELKDFSELSVGDMDAKQEVLEFLDHWGLINFHPVLPSNPDSSMSAVEDESKASPLLDKLYHFQKIPSRSRVAPKKQNASVPAVLPKLIPELAIADDLVRPEGPSVEYHCNSCSGDCSRKRYHCQTQVSIFFQS